MNTGKKRILLLGGSAQQVPIIKKARELGFYTVIMDYLPDNPGQFAADKHYLESTTDVEAVYRIAKAERVEGILAYASDPAALPCAIACERLGLPTNPSASVRVLSCKSEFRQFLRNNGFACPKFFSFNIEDFCKSETTKKEISAKAAGFAFPVVVKPTDASGSKGVTRINSLKEFEEGGLQAAALRAQEFSASGRLICEEFIERGFKDIIGGDIFVLGGKIALRGEMACLREGAGGLVPVGEKKPSGLNCAQRQRLYSELGRLVSLLALRFGEMNIEAIFGKGGDVSFLELGPRAGGNMIPIQLSDVFGVDLLAANILAAVGENPQMEIDEKPGAYMTYVLHSKASGAFAGIELDPQIEPFVYRKAIYKKEGDEVMPFDEAGKACGILFFRFEDEAQMNYFAEKIGAMARVRVAPIAGKNADTPRVTGGGAHNRVALAERLSLPARRAA